MKRIILLLITITTLTNVSYASFPVVEKEHIEVLETIESPTYGNSQPIWGILSLSCAILGILLLPNVYITLILSLLASIFGIIGLTNKVNGMEIIGLILGLLMVILVSIFIGVVLLAGGMH